MGVCTETLRKCCGLTIEETASTIEGEMKGIVGGHTRSGKALAAIHIEDMGEFKKFVGGTGGEGTLHLFFLNDGNGGKMIRPIHNRSPRNPKHPAMLKFTDGSFHRQARPYKGIHFVEEIASRHGG